MPRAMALRDNPMYNVVRDVKRSDSIMRKVGLDRCELASSYVKKVGTPTLPLT